MIANNESNKTPKSEIMQLAMKFCANFTLSKHL